jgi:hypothetical protein
MMLKTNGGDLLKVGSAEAIPASEVYITKTGNFQQYTKSPYSVWTGMWGAFLPQNDTLAFTVDMNVYPVVFPNKTQFNWSVIPDPDWTGINGYLHVDYGNYDDSPGTITPRRANAITDLTVNANWTFSGDAASGLLSECWLTTTSHASGSLTDKAFEISFHPKASASTQSYLSGLPNVGAGSFTDSNGVLWNVKSDTGGATPFISAYRPSFVEHNGALCFDDYFAFLISAGAITGNEWFNGVAFGPEPKSGGASVTVNTFSVTYS